MASEKLMQRRYGIKVVLHLKIHVYLFSKFLLLSIIIPASQKTVIYCYSSVFLSKKKYISVVVYSGNTVDSYSTSISGVHPLTASGPTPHIPISHIFSVYRFIFIYQCRKWIYKFWGKHISVSIISQFPCSTDIQTSLSGIVYQVIH